MIFDELIWIDDLSPRSAALNMAIDEALLMQPSTAAIFHTYRWESRSVSFGYFSKWAPVKEQYPDRDLVRRWTGGGAVEHGEDFTYSLILLRVEKSLRAQALYEALHLSIAEAFRENGKPVALSHGMDDGPSMNCFDRPVQHDVTQGGVKIAGAAIRRLRDRLLLQGSIQRTDLWPDLGSRLVQKLSAVVRKQPVSPDIIGRATCIANEKYGTDVWTRRF
jgi:lipoyl(octanoyl) transferase